MPYATRALSWYLFGKNNFTKPAYEERAAGFAVDDLSVQLQGKNFIVTGGNSGIGKSCVEQLAARGATVFLVCRDRSRGEAAQKEISAATRNPNVKLGICDLASLDSVRSYCSEFVHSGVPLHGLINNAGCMINVRQTTKEGYDENFVTNALGTFLFTELLIPSLQIAGSARVVTIASGGLLTERLKLYDMNERSPAHYNGTRAYAHQKRIQSILSHLWTEKYGQIGISFHTCHPGWADTPAVRTSMPGFFEKNKHLFRTADQGADTAVWLAISDAAGRLPSGYFYLDRTVATEHLSEYTVVAPSLLQQLYPRLAHMASLNIGPHLTHENISKAHLALSTEIPLTRHKSWTSSVDRCATGNSLVSFLLSKHIGDTRAHCVEICELLYDQGKILAVAHLQRGFEDSELDYAVQPVAEDITGKLSDAEILRLIGDMRNPQLWRQHSRDDAHDVTVFARDIPELKLGAVKVVTTIRGSNMSDVLNLMHDRLTQRHAEWNPTYVGGFVIEFLPNDMSYQVWRYSSSGVSPREFVVGHRKLDLPNGAVALLDVSAHHPSAIPNESEFIRCTLHFNLRVFTPNPEDPSSILFEYTNATALNGWIPGWLVTKLNPSVSVEEILHIKSILTKR